MSMTVRELIEHLAQFDDDMEVMIRDQNIPMILHTLEEHKIQREEFIASYGNADSKIVVALG